MKTIQQTLHKKGIRNHEKKQTLQKLYKTIHNP